MEHDIRGRLYCSDRLSEERRAEQDDLEARRICKFCPEGIELGFVKVVKEGHFWRILQTPYRIENAVAHFIVAYKQHITTSAQMLMEIGAGDEYFQLFAEFKREHGLVGCAEFMRDGELEATCASVQHLHGQFVAGSKGHPDTDETLKFDYGYKKK